MGKSSKADTVVTTKAAENAPAKKDRDDRKNDAPSKPRGRTYIDEEQCKGCGLCVAFCPRHVLEMSERFNTKGYHPPEVKQPGQCAGCDLCGQICPDFAIFSVRINNKAKNKGKKKS